MVAPTLVARIDWADKGTLDGAYDTVSPLLGSDDAGIALSRGASADLGAEANGSLRFELDNLNHRYTPDRNWADNPSFENGTSGWNVLAIASLTAAATSIGQVTDNAASAGTKAGEAILTSTVNSGVTYRIPYPFKAGVTYAFEVYLKSMSGTLSVRCGLASAGTPADIASSGSNITASWAAYTGTWTPSADRTDVVVFVRTTAASAATVRLDRVQINAGSAVNAYQEAPTRGQLTAGRAVHLYADSTAKFYGFVDRITPHAAGERVTISCSDVLKKLAEVDVVIPAHALVQRSARDMRIEVLGDFERGTRNLIGNPSFETNTTGWDTTTYGGTISRITTDAYSGTACGEYVATVSTNRVEYAVRLAPIFLAGQVYRFAIYLWTASGSASWVIGMYTDAVSAFVEKTVTVTTTPTRFDITYTVPSNIEASATVSPLGIRAYLRATGAATVRLDAAMVTRGQALHQYADTGTGRWPNFVGNGSFDGAALNGWYDGWTNLIGNPSFETNTTGWATTGDAFTTSGTVIARVAADPAFGVARATLNAASGTGCFYVITGTFKAGVTYQASIYAKESTGSTTWSVGIGSQGTPSDFAESSGSATTTSYVRKTVNWTPSADRTDAHFYVNVAGQTTSIDGAMVVRVDSAAVSGPPGYSDTGPGAGIGSFTTTRALSTSVVKYGYRSQEIATPATAGAGRLYDFDHIGSYFQSGQPFTVSVWLRPTSNMPYRIGIGGNKDDGTWDEASATGTATANVWTQVTVTWTPSGDRDSVNVMDTVLFVYQTDATARTFYSDGVRVIPGSAADDFEMAQWELDTAEGQDVLSTSAGLTGSALSALETINELTLTRHWIVPTMSAPWYKYRTEARSTFLTKASVATFTEDVQGWDDLDIDGAAIVNVVAVSWSGGIEYYSDADSVARHGPRATSINGGGFYPDRTIPDLVGPALIQRYAVQRTRPTLRAEQQYANQLLIGLNDVVTVTIAKFLLRSGQFVVLREDLAITEGGRDWATVYKVEEYPY